jgi:single-stranded-DNA-specific exonuclease
MGLPFSKWHLPHFESCPEAWQRAVSQVLGKDQNSFATAQLLWQRQPCGLREIPGFIDPLLYQPCSALSFGEPMQRAVGRLLQARAQGEKLAIWGDFDTDGITATAVLWEGLGQFFRPPDQLIYYIPNRLQESHGLSRVGLDHLKAWGANLIVTCDTGSGDQEAITYAHRQGMEVIVTDHHTLPAPDSRSVELPVALINPRCLPCDHPLATLSGVAVAYKLLEAFYGALPQPPRQPLETLLDLVAIGLIADLVDLTRDCRYLAQMGLRQLQQQSLASAPPGRPGLVELLRLCKRTGDRPSDISFGLGPRINAVSRIYGDASFCVELLTSRDVNRCKDLAAAAELANSRRKGLQQTIYNQVKERLAQLDLATTYCVILADPQWPMGVLGLVAGQISQELGRPTLLLTIDMDNPDQAAPMARGSARSIKGLDLYQLFQRHGDLITNFGGHPLAAGLSLPAHHLPLLKTALNRSVGEILGSQGIEAAPLGIDLVVTVRDLGQLLFRQLKWLEPYGMGNPVPRLLIRDSWFEKVTHRKLKDLSGQSVSFIKTEFDLWDETSDQGFPGEWWGHYRDELPPGRYDVVVELDHNRYKGYHFKLIDLRPVTRAEIILPTSDGVAAMAPDLATRPVLPPVQHWEQLVGMAKYLARTQTPIAPQRLGQQLGLPAAILDQGLKALVEVGFRTAVLPSQEISLAYSPGLTPSLPPGLHQFLEMVQEENFRRQYRAQRPAPGTPHQGSGEQLLS